MGYDYQRELSVANEMRRLKLEIETLEQKTLGPHEAAETVKMVISLQESVKTTWNEKISIVPWGIVAMSDMERNDLSGEIRLLAKERQELIERLERLKGQAESLAG